MVPAPIFTPFPIFASPRYDKCEALYPDQSLHSWPQQNSLSLHSRDCATGSYVSKRANWCFLFDNRLFYKCLNPWSLHHPLLCYPEFLHSEDCTPPADLRSPFDMHIRIDNRSLSDKTVCRNKYEQASMKGTPWSHHFPIILNFIRDPALSRSCRVFTPMNSSSEPIQNASIAMPLSLAICTISVR